MRRAGTVVAFALALVPVAARARAQGAEPASQTPTPPATIGEASLAFDETARAFEATGAECETMCKALQSMVRATDRLCALVRSGNDDDGRRCVEATAKVDAAKKRVLAACPTCNPFPPPGVGAAGKSEAPTTPPTAMGPRPSYEFEEDAAVGAPVAASSVAGARATHRLTLSLAALPLLLSPGLVVGRLEARLSPHVGLVVHGGGGVAPRAHRASGDGNAAIAGAWTIGAAQRIYLADTFDRAFFALDVTVAGGDVRGAYAVPGTLVGPSVGFKRVFGRGFTVETELGAAVVAADRRAEGTPRPLFVTRFDVGVGWTF